MSYIKNRIIHRFIRDITDYETGGVCYNQILPADTQVYAVYPEQESASNQSTEDVINTKSGLYYVIGDGIHTYTEIRDGHGQSPYNREYRAVPADAIDALLSIFSKVEITNLQDGDYLAYDAKKNAWVNRGGTPIPPTDVIDGGNASDKATNTLDGGNAWTVEFDIIIDGGTAGDQPTENYDGGDASSIPTANYNGGDAGAQHSEIWDGGNAGEIPPVPVIVDGGNTPSEVQTNTIDGTSASQTAFDEILDGGIVI